MAAWDVRRDSFSALVTLHCPRQRYASYRGRESRLASTLPFTAERRSPALTRPAAFQHGSVCPYLSPTADTAAISDLVALGDLTAAMIRFFGTRTGLSRLAILMWLILRVASLRMTTLAGAGLKYLVKKATQRAIATRAIDRRHQVESRTSMTALLPA